MTQRPYGLGGEAYGDPFGTGGPIWVTRARALEGQTVRVGFNIEPTHVSAAGVNDALDPSNYDVAIIVGQGIKPAVVGVKRTIVQGPTAGVLTGEWGVDVQVDRPMLNNLTYRITARRIVARAGGALGAPYSATFPGATVLPTPAAAKIQELNDIATDAVSGGYFTDGSGDLANQGHLANYKKRVVRRLVTVKDAFSWLNNYGLGLRLKRPMSTRELSLYKGDIITQIGQEPETGSVTPFLTLNPVGVLTVQLKITTKRGAFVDLVVQTAPGGVVTVS